MKIINVHNYDALSKQGADILLDALRAKKDINICLATGSSPAKMYEYFVNTINEEKIDISNMTFTKLDEWHGVPKESSFTCDTFIKEHLLDKLLMQPKRVIAFDSETKDVDADLKRVQDQIDACPIDIMILGLGMNGHLGLNEPGDSLTLPCHYAELDEKTKTHDMVNDQKVEGGITIGLKGIFDSKKVLMIVTGSRKEEAFKAFMSQKITTNIPASLLWLHQDCTTLIDQEQFND